MITLNITRWIGTVKNPLSLVRDGEGAIAYPEEIDELDHLQFELRGLPEDEPVELLAGDVVLVPEPDDSWDEGKTSASRWFKRQYLMLHAGTCTLRFRGSSSQTQFFAVELVVRPEKITVSEMDSMLSDLQRLESGLIYDVYSKTEVALNGRRPVRNIVPEVFIKDSENALVELEEALGEVRRRPHHSNRMVWERRSYQPGQLLRPQELFALCSAGEAIQWTPAHDPDAIAVGGRHITIAYVPSTSLVPDLNVYEHRAIRGFLEWLQRALKELSRIARQEHDERLASRGKYDWWEEEDRPRLKSLRTREEKCQQLLRQSSALLRDNPPLAAATSTAPPIHTTAAFARRPAYRRALAAMAMWEAQLGSEVRLNGLGERFRIQDLGKLFEYWGVLTVLDFVRRHFHLVGNAEQDFIDTRRFVVKLRRGAKATFRTGDGRFVKFRYEPEYPRRDAGGKFFGTKYGGSLCPDIAVEVYAKREDLVPEQIIVMDCKYRWVTANPLDSEPFLELEKYRRLIDFSKKTELVRHIWMLYPIAAQRTCSEDPIPEGIDHPYPPEFLTEIPKGNTHFGAIPLTPGKDTNVLVATLTRIFEVEGLLPVSND